MRITASSIIRVMLTAAAVLLCSCATPPFDYTAFKESRPRSILVLPPVNLSPDINAPAAFLSSSVMPLSESGYYVIPVALSDQMFKQNGITVADDAHAIPPGRLREIFGADAALYLTVTNYGASYVVVSSVVSATVRARLVDLKTGGEIWRGEATAQESSNNANAGIVGLLVVAALDQIVNTLTDRAYLVGRQANFQLLSAGYKNGILYGPYHSQYETD